MVKEETHKQEKITSKNLGDLLADKSASEVVEVFRTCCTGRVKTLLNPASIQKALPLLDTYQLSLAQSRYIRDVTDKAAKFLSKRKTVKQFAGPYEELSVYTNNLAAQALLDIKKSKRK